MAKIKDRVLEYLKINKISKQEFCKITGISYANMTGKSLKSEFGGEQISEIVMKFPELNPDWLLLEKGEMYRNQSGKIAVAAAPNSAASNGDMKIEAPSELIDLITSQQETINRMSKTIDALTNK